jgi:hypothetical protein
MSVLSYTPYERLAHCITAIKEEQAKGKRFKRTPGNLKLVLSLKSFHNTQFPWSALETIIGNELDRLAYEEHVHIGDDDVTVERMEFTEFVKFVSERDTNFLLTNISQDWK